VNPTTKAEMTTDQSQSTGSGMTVAVRDVEARVRRNAAAVISSRASLGRKGSGSGGYKTVSRAVTNLYRGVPQICIAKLRGVAGLVASFAKLPQMRTIAGESWYWPSLW
jgi:hypothetical protein